MLVGEETLHSMASDDDTLEPAAAGGSLSRRAPWAALRSWSSSPATEEENLEDRLAYMGENPEITDGREISFHLLRHLSSSVTHQKYHGVDIVSVNVANPRSGGRGHVGGDAQTA